MFKSVDRIVTPGTLLAAATAMVGYALSGSAAQAATGKPGRKAAPPPATAQKGSVPGKVSANKKRTPQPRPLGKRLALTVLEGPDARGQISGITGDNEFAYLYLQPGARVRRDGRAIGGGDVREGAKLICWGSWDRNDPDVFDAVAVSVTGRVDDYALRNKIAAACRKVSRHYAHTPIASAATPTVTEIAAPTAARSAPAQPAAGKPATATPPAGADAPSEPATPAPTAGGGTPGTAPAVLPSTR